MVRRPKNFSVWYRRSFIRNKVCIIFIYSVDVVKSIAWQMALTASRLRFVHTFTRKILFNTWSMLTITTQPRNVSYCKNFTMNYQRSTLDSASINSILVPTTVMFHCFLILSRRNWSYGLTNVITVRLPFLAHSVCMRPNFQGLRWFECDELGEDEPYIRFLLNW